MSVIIESNRICNVILCNNKLIYLEYNDNKDKKDILECPSCHSKYEEYYSKEVGTWVIKLTEKSIRLLEKEQIHNLKIIEGIVKNEKRNIRN
jgi:hypothetical protein